MTDAPRRIQLRRTAGWRMPKPAAETPVRPAETPVRPDFIGGYQR